MLNDFNFRSSKKFLIFRRKKKLCSKQHTLCVRLNLGTENFSSFKKVIFRKRKDNYQVFFYQFWVNRVFFVRWCSSTHKVLRCIYTHAGRETNDGGC